MNDAIFRALEMQKSMATELQKQTLCTIAEALQTLIFFDEVCLHCVDQQTCCGYHDVTN